MRPPLRTVISVALLLVPIPGIAVAQKELGPIGLGGIQGFAVYVQEANLAGPSALTTAEYNVFPKGAGLRGAGFELLVDMLPTDIADQRRFDFALGIGYEYMTGFIARDTSLDLHGSVRSVPLVTIYAEYKSKAERRELKKMADARKGGGEATEGKKGGAPAPVPAAATPAAPPMPAFSRYYVGVRTGVVELWNVRGYNAAGTQYSLDGQTFLFGLLGGYQHKSGFFVEVAGQLEEFRGVDWKSGSGAVTLGQKWPRSLSFSGFTLATGWQFRKKP